MDTNKIWNEYFSGNHDEVIKCGSASAEIMHITALSLVAVKRYEEASTLFMASCLVNPCAAWYCNACIAFIDENQAETALTFALTGLKDFPEDANMNFNAGNVFTANGRHEDAKIAFLKSLAIDSHNWEAAMNLANTYRRLDDMSNAMIYYDIALNLNKDDNAGKIRTRLNKAVTLCDLGYDQQALMMFDELAKDGNIRSPEMDFNRATLKLKLGDYKDGWDLYRRRWECPIAIPDFAEFKKPFLENLNDGIGKKVLFCHEQGFGDSIQFVRYASIMKNMGIDITILCPSPLQRLFETLDIPVITSRENFEYDYECPMLNAPYLFKTDLSCIPNAIPYFNIPEELSNERAFKKDRKNLKVGIVWSGQARDNIEMKIIDNRRSIPFLDFIPFMNVDDVEFCNLQYGQKGHEFILYQFPAFPVPVYENDFDFLDTAAIIKSLDLVITVDTSVAHLSAAVGTPTWILSRYDGCWRWLKDRNDSPWYPDVVRLFHQKERGNWHPVINEVREELIKLVASKPVS